MSQPGLIFREIHQHSKNAFELQEQIDRIPRQIKAQKAKVERMEKEFKDAQDHQKKLKVSIHEKEVTIKELTAQITKHKRQLNEAADQKAIDALQHEIAFAQAEIAKNEEEALTALSEQEEKAATLPEQEKQLKTARDESAKIEKSSSDRKADLEKQLAEANKTLAESVAKLPEDLAAKYKRIAQGMGHDALSPVQGKLCQACATTITSQMYIEVTNLAYVVCKSCNRILYLSEAEQRDRAEAED